MPNVETSMVANTVGVEGRGYVFLKIRLPCAARSSICNMEELWVGHWVYDCFDGVCPFRRDSPRGTPPIGGHHIIDMERMPSIQSRRWGASGHLNGIITAPRYDYRIDAVKSDGILAESSPASEAQKRVLVASGPSLSSYRHRHGWPSQTWSKHLNHSREAPHWLGIQVVSWLDAANHSSSRGSDHMISCIRSRPCCIERRSLADPRSVPAACDQNARSSPAAIG